VSRHRRHCRPAPDDCASQLRVVRFATPWRNHVIFPALLLALIFCAAYFGLRGSCGSRAAKLARGVFIWVALDGSDRRIGLFDGGYNHAAILDSLMRAQRVSESIGRIYEADLGFFRTCERRLAC
jgi:hypothetical protein